MSWSRPSRFLADSGMMSAKRYAAPHAWRKGRRAAFSFTRSILFTTRITRASGGSRPRMARSSGHIASRGFGPTSVTSTTTSPPRAAASASWFMKAPRGFLAACMPGVSVKMSCRAGSV